MIDATETDDLSIIGEAAHIVAEQPDGPRGDGSMPIVTRNSYSNLILLCNVHHKQVDDQPNKYSIDTLKIIKLQHEAWVRSQLESFNAEQQKEDEIWAGYIDEWCKRAHIATWTSATHSLLQAVPGIQSSFLTDLEELKIWLLSRVWPQNRFELQNAFENFRLILNDLTAVFNKYSDESDRDHRYVETEKFYKIGHWNPELYARKLLEFEYHVDLVEDLAYELTRASNLICDKVRACLESSFRRDEGVLLVIRGMDMTLRETTIRVEYRGAERVQRPYPGLRKFMEIRIHRDFHVGQGVSQVYTS